MFEKKAFFDVVRAGVFRGRMSQSQVDGMTSLLDVWFQSYHDRFPKEVSLKMLAYMLATAYHETAHKMQPVRETLATSDRQAISRLDSAYRRGVLGSVKNPYWKDGWFGRGYVQLTHKANYQKASEEIGVDFVRKPSLAMDPHYAALILYNGSIEGWFTGKKLGDYITEHKADYKNARRVINGLDKAQLIAGYAEEFYVALWKSLWDTDGSPDVMAAYANERNYYPPTSEKRYSTQKMGILGGGVVAGSAVANEVYNNLSFISFGSVVQFIFDFVHDHPLTSVAILCTIAYIAYNWSERSRYQKDEGI